MSYKITNTTRHTLKKAVPLTISFDDGFGTIIKHVIEPDKSIIMEFIPTTVHALQIRNCVNVEFISNNNILPPLSSITPTSVNTPVVPIEDSNEEDNEEKDFIESDSTDNEPVKKNNKKKVDKTSKNNDESTENDIETN